MPVAHTSDGARAQVISTVSTAAVNNGSDGPPLMDTRMTGSGTDAGGAPVLAKYRSHLPSGVTRGFRPYPSVTRGSAISEHGLPPGWELMIYEEFLAARRPRMAEIIRIAFRKLGGEASASPLVPPWFLPGAEVVWQRIGDVELKLRNIVREVYRQRFGDKAAAAIEGALDARGREVLAHAVRNRPAGVDGLGVVDYLYLAQLPALLFKPDVVLVRS
jgi:hypothetical protein